MSEATKTRDPASLPKHFEAAEAERRWDEQWQKSGIHHWDATRSRAETFVVDTPPPANGTTARLTAMLDRSDLPSFEADAGIWRRAIYRVGTAAMVDKLLLEAARKAADVRQHSAWRAAWDLARSWRVPHLPVKGADAIAAGVPAGPAIGELLRAVESWWIAGDFKGDRDACLARLNGEAKSRGFAC